MIVKANKAVVAINALVVLTTIILCPITLAAQTPLSKYVGQTECNSDFQPGPGISSIRLDRSQRAYLKAFTVGGKDLLAIVQYVSEADKCGIVRDLIESARHTNAFEFQCTDPQYSSGVVVGTRPETDARVSGAAAEAWRIDLKKLAFMPDRNRVVCERRGYAGNDEGDDLAIWAKQRAAKKQAPPHK